MSIIKKTTKIINLAIVLITLITIITGIILITNKDKIIVDEIKDTYSKKKDLNEEQIKQIKCIIKNKKTLSTDEEFILGYYYLFEEDNKELAYSYFEKVIKNTSSTKSNFAKVYSCKFLSDKYLEEGNTEKGLEFAKHACYSINPKKYPEYLNLMNDIFRPILDLKEGREIIINFLEGVLIENYKKSNDEVEFYAYRTLEQFYTLNGDLPNAIQASIKTIDLARKLNKEYFKGKSIINLSRVLYEFEDYDNALALLNLTKSIEPEDPEWKDKLNIYRLINLAQIELKKENYNKVLDYVNELEEYKYNISKEDWLDTAILQKITKAQVYIIQDTIELATKYLEEAKVLMEIDEVVYFPDKDIYYHNVYGTLYEKIGKYELAIEEYKKSKQLSIERSNIEGIEESTLNLKSIYKNIGNEIEYKSNSLELIKIKDYKEQKIHQDSYNYIIKNYELNKIKEHNKTIRISNIILLSISIIVIILIYIINIHPKIKKRILSTRIEKRIRNNEYILNYQPITNPKKNEIVGYEALLRLESKGKIIMPYILIKELEQSNMMGQISIYILKQIIKDYMLIKEKGKIRDDFYISMNVSSLEIEDDKIIEKFISIFNKSQLKRDSLCIEITENAGINDLNIVKTNIDKLRGAGFKIAIDDFGVEYSNLSILQSIEYDIVKLDKIFIDNIETSEVNKSIIEFCDYLFSKKDKVIVIEGVEDYNQMEFVKNMKYDKFYIQGYYYSKPLKLEHIL